MAYFILHVVMAHIVWEKLELDFLGGVGHNIVAVWFKGK